MKVFLVECKTRTWCPHEIYKWYTIGCMKLGIKIPHTHLEILCARQHLLVKTWRRCEILWLFLAN